MGLPLKALLVAPPARAPPDQVLRAPVLKDRLALLLLVLVVALDPR